MKGPCITSALAFVHSIGMPCMRLLRPFLVSDNCISLCVLCVFVSSILGPKHLTQSDMGSIDIDYQCHVPGLSLHWKPSVRNARVDTSGCALASLDDGLLATWLEILLNESGRSVLRILIVRLDVCVPSGWTKWREYTQCREPFGLPEGKHA